MDLQSYAHETTQHKRQWLKMENVGIKIRRKSANSTIG